MACTSSSNSITFGKRASNRSIPRPGSPGRKIMRAPPASKCTTRPSLFPRPADRRGSPPDAAVHEHGTLRFHSIGDGVVQIGLLQARAAEIPVGEVRARQIGPVEIRLFGRDAAQFGVLHASRDKACAV